MNKKNITIIVILVILILVFTAIVLFFSNLRQENTKELGYELSKPSIVNNLPHNVPIYFGAVADSYSKDSFTFKVGDSQNSIINFYTDYFNNKNYNIEQEEWCGDPVAMFCGYMGHTLKISNVEGDEFVEIRIGEYKKVGAYFTLKFATIE